MTNFCARYPIRRCRLSIVGATASVTKRPPCWTAVWRARPPKAGRCRSRRSACSPPFDRRAGHGGSPSWPRRWNISVKTPMDRSIFAICCAGPPLASSSGAAIPADSWPLARRRTAPLAGRQGAGITGRHQLVDAQNCRRRRLLANRDYEPRLSTRAGANADPVPPLDARRQGRLTPKAGPRKETPVAKHLLAGRSRKLAGLFGLIRRVLKAGQFRAASHRRQPNLTPSAF